MITTSVPLRRRILTYTVRAILIVVWGWTQWGIYLASLWVSRYYVNNELMSITWLVLVTVVFFIAGMGFFFWFFRWLIRVVYDHMLNR